jgi:lipopolysaccharide transport system ATP-binding protein
MNEQSIVIEVKNVSKVFNSPRNSLSLRRGLTSLIKSSMNKRSDKLSDPPYVLKDINLSVRRGESVGIIGRNGAGKTTLLRMLSRIIRPTTGTVSVNGTYAALIGIGTGFSDTLTGRKNIYLNSAINGINPSEVEATINDIIEFADIGNHIDSLVKDYSTGMRARLAFSIATHNLPDIVFLDEVLSVGDITFNQKSKKKLQDLLSENRTVIFVSHSNDAILEICNRVIWLHNGQIQLDGDAESVVQAYSEFMLM